MEAQLNELLGFLHDRNPQVRQIALSNLLPHTPNEAPLRRIFFAQLDSEGLAGSKEPIPIRDLKLLCRDQPAIAHDAFRAIVNLSDSALIAPYLSEPRFLEFLVAYILHPQALLADLACMALSNITVNPSAIQELLSLKVRIEDNYPIASRSATAPAPPSNPLAVAQQKDAVASLVEAFIDAAAIPGEERELKKRKGDLHFLASVFANITVTPAGRLSLLSVRDETQEFLLSGLFSFTEHPDTIRRGGVASTLKNIAFHAPAHMALLETEYETVSIPPDTTKAKGMNLLSSLLLPLVGPEEFDLEDTDKLPTSIQFLPSTKKREPDSFIRLTHIETLLLLCTTRPAREYMRVKGVYEVVQKMHETEENVQVMEHIERLVNFLKRDEGAEIEQAPVDEAKKQDRDDDDDDAIIEI